MIEEWSELSGCEELLEALLLESIILEETSLNWHVKLWLRLLSLIIANTKDIIDVHLDCEICYSSVIIFTLRSELSEFEV
jgi:hypothetical protein